MNLSVFSSVLSSQTWRENLSGIQARQWRRSIRRLGGPWMGTLKYSRASRSECLDFFYTALGSDLREFDGGVPSWRGIIAEIDEPYAETIGEERVYTCDVTILGYVHTLAWQTVAGAHVDDSFANASAWLSAIITAHGPYVASQAIDTNTLQVQQSNSFGFSAWDEISRITELGDGTVPWRFEIDVNRTARYTACSNTPVYYARGGLIRRRSLLKMTNYVNGTYNDSVGAETALAAASDSDSIAIYGQRELYLRRSGFPQATMEALRDTTLAENSFPWPRVVGARGNVQLFDTNYSPVSRWLVVPAVVRDISYPVVLKRKSGWLTDDRDTYIEEVEASENGLTVKTWDFQENELMSIQYDYAAKVGEEDFDLRD